MSKIKNLGIFGLAVVLGTAIIGPPPFVRAADNAPEVIRNLLDTMNVTSQMRISLDIFDAQAKPRESRRSILVTVFAPDRDTLKSFVRVDEPPSFKGARFLMITSKSETGQWIYLPAFHKVTRVSADSRDDAILDSDFSYFDLKGESLDDFDYALGDDAARVEAEKACGEASTAIVAVPKRPGVSIYPKRLLFVSKRTGVNCLARDFDASGARVKEIVATDFKQYDGLWRPGKILVTSFGQTGERKTYTEILLTEWKIHQKVDQSMFKPAFLESGGK